MTWKVLLVRASGEIIHKEFPTLPHPEIWIWDPKPQNINFLEAGDLGKPPSDDKIRFKIYAARDNTLFYEEVK